VFVRLRLLARATYGVLTEQAFMGTPNRTKLTKGYIDRIQPESKDTFHWDSEVKGFGVRVSPAGKLVFIVQGRVAGTKAEPRMTIGPYGVFTVDQARDVAREHLRSMRMGVDPREARRLDEARMVTLAQVAAAYFARPGKLKDGTKAEMERHVERVFGDWKDRPIADITEGDVKKRYRDMATKGLRGAPAPGQANLSMTTLRTLINFAARQYKRGDGSPLIQHNPVEVLRDDWIELKPRTRDVEEGKVGEVWSALTGARVKALNDDARSGIDLARFLLLTGARRNEGAMLTWDRVNLEEGWWHLPDPKNANPVWLPLSSQAVAVLRERPGPDMSPFVFPTRSKAGHVMDTRSPLALISKIAKQTLSAHDLRRTFVSLGVATLGIDLYKMELLTNHVPKGITARHYLQTSRLQYLLPQVQMIGDWIEAQGQLAEAKANGANVVPLRA
jgi:integrase